MFLNRHTNNAIATFSKRTIFMFFHLFLPLQKY